jgi:DNA (cytosine-5)-methyltransferase 1
MTDFGAQVRAAPQLVLSLFPGIGLLDMAFEEEGFCVVRGPDLLWGGDIRRFHPPAGKFDGVIGGPPCQLFSQLRYLNPKAGQAHGNMIPEFERVVAVAAPEWFVMENVPAAPEPVVPGFCVRSTVVNTRWLGEIQERTRRFSFGTREGRTLAVEFAALEHFDYTQAVTSSARAVNVKIGGNGKVKRTYSAEGKRHGPGQGARADFGEMAELQGLPRDFLSEAPFTISAKRQIVGNGVPLPMGRAVARAVKRALGIETVAHD